MGIINEGNGSIMAVNRMKNLQTKHLVAIDLGSNSFHMVVAREQAGCLQIIHTNKERVNLAAGLDDNGHLHSDAIQRGVACLEKFNHNFALGNQDSVRVVATHTLRKAHNRQDFIHEARKRFPFDIEVIDGISEARLIYQGVAHTHPIRGNTLVVDIGGGSTEVILGSNFDVKQAISLEAGSGVLSKRLFKDGQVTVDSINTAQQQVVSLLEAQGNGLYHTGWDKVVGTSGSIKVIAQAMQELFDDKLITANRLTQLSALMVEAGDCSQLKLQRIDRQRLPQLPGAVAILLALFDWFKIVTVEYCASALREGVLYGLSESSQEFDPRHRTINNLATLYRVDHDYGRRVIKQLQNFYQVLEKRGWILTRHEQMLLDGAAQLHEIGISINAKKRQVHGAYIIANSLMPGFNATEHLALTYLVRNHRGRVTHDGIEEIGLPRSRLQALSQLLRLAILLTRGRVAAPVHAMDIYFAPPSLVVVLTATELNDSGLMSALQREVATQVKSGMKLVLNKFSTE